MTERGQRMQKRTVRRSRQLSAESIAKDLQTLCDLQKILMEWVSMSEQLHPSLTTPSAMQSVRYNGVKHTATGL
ncbi:unnamed protein product [Staurois parvus]|uniref:Uncharacterized protein n=1 Tax=Staurois parvus TaxID=386267 RepID=A0ABN9BJR3_9NEOB|nr:unnamed protein product [Staurois parvus]